jgi:ATP-binding cassette subfamily C protein PrsD
MVRDDSISGNVVSAALRGTSRAWIHVAVFSTIVNLLMLTGSIYMMQVYDRVLASRSVATLVGVSIIALAAYALQGWLDHIRLQMLGRIGAAVDAELAPLTVRAAMSAPVNGANPTDALQPFRDLAALRTFLGSLGPTALIDIPFAPVFLLVCFMLHPWLGWLAISGMLMIVGLTVLTERFSAAPGKRVAQSGSTQFAMLETGRRNAEAISALGMSGSFSERFDLIHARHVDDYMQLSQTTGRVNSFAKMFRLTLQSAVLGLGALLVIRGEMSGGSMLAASVLTSRALAPVELAVAHLKVFIAARQGYARLKAILPEHEASRRALSLPAPSRTISVEDVTLNPPSSRRFIVMSVRFQLSAGQSLGLIGPSGSGKSSLARALVGIWQPARGAVRLDGALMTQWDGDNLGRSIGYLPQDVELFPGTIAENIARFDPEATSDDILAATAIAGAHDMIVALPEGYETVVGEGGAALSGGQRQRIALARALYGDPFLVVLDEPNSSLDADGDNALAAAIQSVKARRGVVIVITHRPSGLSAVDLVGVMNEGRLQAFGPRDEVLAATTRSEPMPERAPRPAAAAPDTSPRTADALEPSIRELRRMARTMRDAEEAREMLAQEQRAHS